MQYLSRRPSAVYVFRLAVPAHLRQVFGKREVIATSGTRELCIAKVVAGSLAAQWLQHFNESDHLLAVANPAAMSHQKKSENCPWAPCPSGWRAHAASVCRGGIGH